MTIWQDARFALRQLRKTPGFTAVVLATLGLSIGANSAIYSVLDAVLLRPAPYPEAGRLAMVVTVFERGDRDNSQTGTQFESVRDGASASLDVAAYSGVSEVNFVAPGHLESIHQQRVSAGFFRVLGVTPQYGREFLAAEDQRGGLVFETAHQKSYDAEGQHDPHVDHFVAQAVGADDAQQSHD